MKFNTYEYVDSCVIDGKEITAKFDVDYGCRETRDCPGDPGGLYITEAVVDGKDVIDELTDEQIETLTRHAENVFWTEHMEEENEGLEYLRELSEGE